VRLDLFVKLKYESSNIILFVGIRYSMRDLLSDLNNYALPADRPTVNDDSASWLSHQLVLASYEFYF